MTRTEALERFFKEHHDEKEKLRQEFIQQVPQKLEQLIEQIFTAFGEVGKSAQQRSKEDCVHFLFALQRCDLLLNKAIVRLDVMNSAWYMDEDILSAQLDLTAEYWYRINLHAGDCRKKQMFFTTFEDCQLSHMDFSKAGMWGCRFIRCYLDNCDFSKSNLQQADFEDCQFINNNFTAASLNQATFSEVNFPWEAFAEEQLDELFLIKSA